MDKIEDREVFSLIVPDMKAHEFGHPSGLYGSEATREEHTVILYDIAAVLNALRSKYAHTPSPD